MCVCLCVSVCLQGRAIISAQCKPSDVLLNADVAIGTHWRLLSSSSSTSFYFSWAQLVAKVFVSMATLQSDATKPSQNPLPSLPGSLGTIPAQRAIRYYRLAHWLTDWCLRRAAVLAQLALTHNSRILPHSLSYWLRFSTTLWTVS